MSTRIKKSSIILFTFLFLADNCLWLFNARIISLAVELCWMSILVMFILMFAGNNFKEIFNKNKYNFGRFILFFFVMGIYACVQAYLIYRQPFVEGLAPQRDILCAFLSYFVFIKCLNTGRLQVSQFKLIFLNLGYIELVLYIGQYFLINSIRFLQVSYSYRLGDVRLNLNAMAVPYVVFFSLNNIFKSKKWQIKDFLSVVAGLFYVFQITKTRIALAGYLIAIFGGYLIWKRGGKKKLIVGGCLIVFILYMTNTELFGYLIDGINNVDASAQAREFGRTVYLGKILEHPLFGCGYVNTNNAAAVNYAAMNEGAYGGIFWVDLGVYGLTFFFGFIGLLWFVFLFGKMTYKSFKLAIKGNLTYFMYMLYMIVISPNGTGFIWYFVNAVGFIIMLCFIEVDDKVWSKNYEKIL